MMFNLKEWAFFLNDQFFILILSYLKTINKNYDFNLLNHFLSLLIFIFLRNSFNR